MIYFLLFIVSIGFFILAFLEKKNRSVEKDIYYRVRYRLCASSMGNPLHLRPGELEPEIFVVRSEPAVYFVFGWFITRIILIHFYPSFLEN